MSTAGIIADTILPALVAMLIVIAGGFRKHRAVVAPTIITGLIALFVGFFAVFTVAWSIDSVAAIWLTSIGVGVLVGFVGLLVTAEKAHG